MIYGIVHVVLNQASSAAAHLPKNLPKNMDDATIPANFPSGKQIHNNIIISIIYLCCKSINHKKVFYESPTMQRDLQVRFIWILCKKQEHTRMGDLSKSV